MLPVNPMIPEIRRDITDVPAVRVLHERQEGADPLAFALSLEALNIVPASARELPRSLRQVSRRQ
jgi:hypothetical protein